ncbi:MAG TPA: serine hydrolase [Candidatus Paceibacterota bacterium]|nr:serine hydrolase [Candidatus Paceibacterota bacterium]
MRRTFALPLLILAGLTAFALFDYLSRPSTSDQIDQTIEAGQPDSAAAQAYVLPFANPAYAPVRDTTVRDPQPDATSAIVYDLDAEQVLWSRNANLPIPVASLTKLLTAMVADERWDPDEIVTVSSTAAQINGTKLTLYADEQLTVRDLLRLMLIESSNDAAYALADHARSQGTDFVAEMNRKAWVLGMRDCAFRDPAGLDDTARCTASDMIRLIRAALRQAPNLWPIMSSASATVLSIDGKFVHEATNTNELLDEYSGIVGGKTGNTDGALGCLFVVVQSQDKRDTLITVVLGSRQRFTDTRLLLEWASAAYGFQ